MSFSKRLAASLRSLVGAGRSHPIQNQPEQFMQQQWMDGVLGWYGRHTTLQRDRRSAYYDFEQIGDFVLGASALDMYTEDAFPYDHQKNATIWVSSQNPKVSAELNKLMNRIDVNTLVPSMAYTTALYGDEFSYLLFSDRGIEAVRQIFPYLLTRIEDQYGRLRGFTPGIHDFVDGRDPEPNPISQPYEVIHTRLPSAFMRHTGHGLSMLNPVRYIWRQLKIMLDGLVLYRWTKGVDRTVYYVDTGTNPPEKQMEIVHRWRQQIKKRSLFDPAQDTYKQEWYPEQLVDDIFWPLPKGSNSRVEKLGGSANVTEVADVQYYTNLFFAGLRIPKAHMGFEGEIMAREVLPYQSIRYANVAYRLQRAVLSSLARMFQIHLLVIGIDSRKKENAFIVHAPTISHLYDVAQNELLTAKMELLQKLIEFGDTLTLDRSVWLRYLLQNYLDIDENMVQALLPASSLDQGEFTDSEDLDRMRPQDRDAVHKAFMDSPTAQGKLRTLREMQKFFSPSYGSADLPHAEEYDKITRAVKGSSDFRTSLMEVIDDNRERVNESEERAAKRGEKPA